MEQSHLFMDSHHLNIMGAKIFSKKLINSIVNHLKSLAPKQDALLTRERHIEAIKRSIHALNDMQKIDLNMNPEIASENLRIVAKEIGNITNIIDVEELLDDIFSSFCIGK